MELTQYVLLGVVIAGITELMNRLRAKDLWVAATIVTSALTGLLFGFLGVEGLEPITGLAAGFGVSGSITVAHAFGSAKKPAAESDVVK